MITLAKFKQEGKARDYYRMLKKNGLEARISARRRGNVSNNFSIQVKPEVHQVILNELKSLKAN
jgi:hypothetical protein